MAYVAEQREHLTLEHLQVDTIDGDNGAAVVLLAQVANADTHRPGRVVDRLETGRIGTRWDNGRSGFVMGFGVMAAEQCLQRVQPGR